MGSDFITGRILAFSINIMPPWALKQCSANCRESDTCDNSLLTFKSNAEAPNHGGAEGAWAPPIIGMGVPYYYKGTRNETLIRCV